MNQVNLVARLEPRRLNVQLPTMHARQLHSFALTITNIPDDVTAVFVAVYTPQGTRYDIPGSRRPNTPSGVAYLLPTVFPETGSATYEVSATDAQGYETALGAGTVEIGEFSSARTPVPPDVPVAIQQIPDAAGRMHTIKAVPDGEGGYTTIVED